MPPPPQPPPQPLPSSFVCPLSGRVMQDPVMDPCAHVYDRACIERWLSRHDSVCPISNKPLAVLDLVPHHVLAERIERWQFEHNNNVIAGSDDGNLRRWRQRWMRRMARRGDRRQQLQQQQPDGDDGEKIALGAPPTEFILDVVSNTARAAATAEIELGAAPTAQPTDHENRRPLRSNTKRERLKRQRQQQRVCYESIPADLMLLPQERAALERARSRQAAAAQIEWRRTCCRKLVGGLVVTVCLLGIAVLLRAQMRERGQ